MSAAALPDHLDASPVEHQTLATESRSTGEAGPPRVVVIGGGFTGTMFAVHVARSRRATVTLVERGEHVGRGIAYGAAGPGMLLNVRAANMSAFPEEPDHFTRWLDVHHPGSESPFVERRVYGAYLADVLRGEMLRCPGSITVRRAEAVDISRGGRRFSVALCDRSSLTADIVVLATGNLPPVPVRELAAVAANPSTYVNDPWTSELGAGLDADDEVLLIGTGLTAVDVALSLDDCGFPGRITALSRRGLLPHAHVRDQVRPPALEAGASTRMVALVRALRARARTAGWRTAVDEIRPCTQSIWSRASSEERSRFLRHLRPWWDIHRHRLAPEVRARIDRLSALGRFSIVAGRLVGARLTHGNRADVTWQARGTRLSQTRRFSKIINCTGPASDLTRIQDPLLANLLKRGAIRPDPHFVGIDANTRSEAIGTDGVANPDLLVLGPMTRGALWEVVAVPDIRVQVAAVAGRLADSLSRAG